MEQECDETCCSHGMADCGNRTLQLRKWKNVEAFNTGGPRGYGLRCLEQLFTGDIVLEMCGEVYNVSAFGEKVSFVFIVCIFLVRWHDASFGTV